MPSRRPRTWGWIVAAVGTALGVWFASRVPPGLPYDEPAHWSTVLYYAQQHRMPVLGDPGVAYEAQMGPVYYVLAAVVASAAGAVSGGADGPAAFYTVRIAGVALIPLLTWLTYRLARAVHADPAVAVTASALVAVNPLMLATAGSVTNDYLSFVAVLVAVSVAVKVSRAPSPWWRHLGLGVLVGLAVLTKVVALVLVPTILLAYAWRGGRVRDRAVDGASLLAGVVVTCGWWFARNLALYGDLTGARGVARLGIDFPPLRICGVGDLGVVLGQVVSYVYVPVEYFRNALATPTPLKLGAIGLCVVTVAALAWFAGSRLAQHGLTVVTVDPGRVTVVCLPVLAVGAWLVYAAAVWAVPVRLAFQAASAAAILLAIATRPRPGGALRVLTLAAFVLADVWLLVAVRGAPSMISLR